MVPIDIEEIGDGSDKYKDASGSIVAPEAVKCELPSFILEYVEKHGLNITHGTVVVIEKIDRLTFSTTTKLIPYLLQQCGVTYRNFLRRINISVDGQRVEPIDPLFITEGFRNFDEDDDRAIPVPTVEIRIKHRETQQEVGLVKVRYSLLPPTFLRKPESKYMMSASASGNNKRFAIRKDNNGIIVLRAGRQIDVINSKCPWTTFQNNDRYIGIEIDFAPTLDEEFSITTSKQQIGISERMWDILKDNGVKEAITQLRKDWNKLKKEFDEKVKKNKSGEDEEKKNVSEAIMAAVASTFAENVELLPVESKNQAAKNFEEEIEQRSVKSGVPKELVRKALESEVVSNPYKLNFVDEEEAPFYRAKQIGGQVNIFINKSHRFYSELYEGASSSKKVKYALEILLFVLGESELRVTPERQNFYKTERANWSLRLQAALENLSQHFSGNEDDSIFNEELKVSQEG